MAGLQGTPGLIGRYKERAEKALDETKTRLRRAQEQLETAQLEAKVRLRLGPGAAQHLEDAKVLDGPDLDTAQDEFARLSEQRDALEAFLLELRGR